MPRGVEARAREAEAMSRGTAPALEEGDDAGSVRLADLAGFYGTLAEAFRETVENASVASRSLVFTLSSSEVARSVAST